MITAIMIITSMYIQGDMRTHMPSMEECMDAKMQVMEQDASLKMKSMMRDMLGAMKEFSNE